MYGRRTGVFRPKKASEPRKVSVEGHFEDHPTFDGNRRMWVPGQLVVECRCGEKLRPNRDSIRCRRGVDHAALLRKATRELAQNSVVPRGPSEGEKSIRVVYKASEILRALTRATSREQIPGATSTPSGPKNALYSWESLDGEASNVFAIEDAIVVGDIDLRHHTIERTLVAKNCWFVGEVDLRYCKFEQTVYFVDCTFERIFNSGDTRGSHTVYEKELHCSGSHFKKAASFNGINVEGSAYFQGSMFELEQPERSPDHMSISDQYTVDFTTASFGVNIECKDAQFEGPVSLNSVSCGGNGIFNLALFRKGANFAAASLDRNLQCSDAKFHGPVSFNSLKCGGAAIFDRVLFKKSVNLRFTSLGLALKCEGANFGDKVDCTSMSCDHNVRFEDARFEGAKEVVLTNATLRGDLGCKRAVFNDKLNFRGLKCDGTGNFQNATFTGGELDGRYSRFGGDLDLRGAYSASKMRLGQSSVLGKLRLGGSRFEKSVELYNTNSKILELLDHDYDIKNRHLTKRRPTVPEKVQVAMTEAEHEENIRKFSAENFEVVVEKGRTLEHVFKRPASKVKKLRKLIKLKAWSRQDDKGDLIVERLFPFEPRRLNLTDISFERFHAGPNRRLARELAERLLEAQDPCKFSRDPYLNLEKYYSSIGQDDDADDIHYMGHCALRANAKARRKNPDKGMVNWSRRMLWGDFLWKWSTGYGQKMYRLLILFLFFVAVGTAIFWSDRALMLPSDTKTPLESQQMAWKPMDRAVYSVDLLLPVLDLRTGDVRMPNYALEKGPRWAETMHLRWGEILKWYEVFHIFVGWLLVGLLLAWITAKARGM
jgi:hypothetical protein